MQQGRPPRIGRMQQQPQYQPPRVLRRQPQQRLHIPIQDPVMRQITSQITILQQYLNWYLDQPTFNVRRGALSLRQVFSRAFVGLSLPQNQRILNQSLQGLSDLNRFFNFYNQRVQIGMRKDFQYFQRKPATLQYLRRVRRSFDVPVASALAGIQIPRIVIPPMSSAQRALYVAQSLQQHRDDPIRLSRKQFLVALIVTQTYFHFLRARAAGRWTVAQWNWIMDIIKRTNRWAFVLQHFRQTLQTLDLQQRRRYQLNLSMRGVDIQNLFDPFRRYILPQFIWLFRSPNRRNLFDNQVVQLQGQHLHIFLGADQGADFGVQNLFIQGQPVRQDLEQFRNYIQMLNVDQQQRQIVAVGVPLQINQDQIPVRRARWQIQNLDFNLLFQRGFQSILYRIQQLNNFTITMNQQQDQVVSNVWINQALIWRRIRTCQFSVTIVFRFQGGWKTWKHTIQQPFSQLIQQFNQTHLLSLGRRSTDLADKFIQALKFWIRDHQNLYLGHARTFQIGTVKFTMSPVLDLWQIQTGFIGLISQRNIRWKFDILKATFFPGVDQRIQNWWVFNKDYSKHQSKQYVIWSSRTQNINAIRNQYPDQFQLCWVKVLKYVQFKINRKIIGTQQFFRSGRLWSAIQIIVKQSDYGFFNRLQFSKNIIIQSRPHIYLSGRHVGICQWKEIDYFLKTVNRNTAYSTRNITSKKTDQANIDRFYSTCEANIRSWNQKRVLDNKNIPMLPMQCIVDRVIFQNCLFVDIQCLATIDRVQKCFLACMVGCPYVFSSQDQWVFKDFDNYNAAGLLIAKIKQFTLNYRYDQQHPLTIWFFNGIKYQMAYFYRHLQNLFGQIQSYGQPGQSKAFTVNEKSVIFRDVRTILPVGSLKQLSKKYAKNQSQIKKDFHIQKIKQQYQAQQHIDQITKYCLQDCYATAYLLRNHYQGVQKVNQQLHIQRDKPKISFNQIYKKLTTPGLACLFMFYYFLDEPITDNQPQFLKSYQRQGYYGGITQVFKHRVEQMVQSYDINSSYPDQMTLDQPWFFSRQLQQRQVQQIYNTRQRWNQSSSLDFIILDSFDHHGGFPWIPHKHQTGLIYPNSSKAGPYFIWGKQLQDCDFTSIKAKRVFRYTSSYFNKQGNQIKVNTTGQYSRFFYQLKLRMKRQKNQVMQSLYKLFLNSAYGKLGQRLFYSHSLVGQQWQFQLNQMAKVTETSWGRLISRPPTKQRSIGDFVRVASFISASARSKLAKVGQLVGMKNVYYCDTDSLYVKFGTFPKQLISQTQLGVWKRQRIFRRCLFIAPKCSISQTVLTQKDLKKQGKQWYIGMPAQYRWIYKWKGVPLKFLNKGDSRKMFDQISADIEQLCKRKDLVPFKSYVIGRCIHSQRWSRGSQGITIQQFWRSTSIWIKKTLMQDSSLKPFDF